MTMRRGTFLKATLAAVAGTPALAREPAGAAAGTADLIVTGATVHTVDDAQPHAQAFAVRGGRFVYVGSPAGALALRGSHTEVLDLPGRTVLPGLIDAHLHLTGLGLDLQEADLYGVNSPAELVARTLAFAKTSPDRWIRGDGWDQNRWPDKAFPTHDELSRAFPDRPVVLGRVDGHALLANATAMALAGITAATPDPAGGRIVRDARGVPTGVFIDNAMHALEAAVPPPSPAQLERAIRAAAAQANRWGLTTVAEPGVSAAMLAAHQRIVDAGAATLRHYAMLSDDPGLIAGYLASGPVVAANGGLRWIRSIKLFADGALGSRGAALLAPYSDDPGNSGLLRISRAHVQDVRERALRAGFQTCVHAIGDRANRLVLDAFEAALRTVPVADPRLRIEHAQVLAQADIPRFAQLGVIPSMQTTHQISDMGWAQARLGPERVRGAYAWRSLLESGVIIANGTDAPVEPVNPLRTFHAAIAREDETNSPPGGWYPQQRMNRNEALKSMTLWAAHANFMDEVTGSIAPGKFADFVVMDRDWLSAAPEAIMGTTIVGTYLGGVRVYDGSSVAAAPRPRAKRTRSGTCCGLT